MWFFRNPKCPKCGSITVKTYYAFPYPQFRCNNCFNKKQKL